MPETPGRPVTAAVGARFRATLQEANGAGLWVEIPTVVAARLPEKRAAVRALVSGHEYHSRVAVYGGRSYLGLRAELRRAADVELGDVLDIELFVDDQPRLVEEPEELVAALDGSAEARRYYDGLSYTHRKEYARWIGEAKRAETRQRRATKAITMLLAGTKTPD